MRPSKFFFNFDFVEDGVILKEMYGQIENEPHINMACFFCHGNVHDQLLVPVPDEKYYALRTCKIGEAPHKTGYGLFPKAF
jgi:hypothetical protein